jgi:hypothetical protein
MCGGPITCWSTLNRAARSCLQESDQLLNSRVVRVVGKDSIPRCLGDAPAFNRSMQVLFHQIGDLVNLLIPNEVLPFAKSKVG